MNAGDAERPASNPFATRFVRPGAMAYLFPAGAGDDVARLAEALEAHGHWGQIIGPHGSGKSTLLAALVAELRGQGRRVVAIELHDGERRLPVDLSEIDDSGLPTTVTVDGYEQLGWAPRANLQRLCRQCGWGLLVTAHDDVGLPTLWSTSIDRALARRIVAQLWPASDPPLPADRLAALVDLHGQDMRSLLFDLYDHWENRR